MMRTIMYIALALALVLAMALPLTGAVVAGDITTSSLGMDLSVNPSETTPTGTLYYSLTLTNMDVPGANDVEVDVYFYPPGPTGAKEAYGPGVLLDQDLRINVGESVTYNWDGSGGAETRPALAVALQDIPLDQGITVVYAASEFDGNYLASPPYSDHSSKNIPATIMYPDTEVTIAASEAVVARGSPVELTITEKNTGDVPLTGVYVQVWQNGVLWETLDDTHASRTSDMNMDNVLDVGETWSWTISSDPITESPTTFVALGFGTDPLDNVISYDTGYPGEMDEVTVELLDLGFTAALGDTVWNDLNRDGIQDANEPVIQGVTVRLYDCDGKWLETKTTDEFGYYMFESLPEGSYQVEFVLPAGYAFSPRYQGVDAELDSNADPVTGRSECVPLAEDETNPTIDAGMYEQERDSPPAGPSMNQWGMIIMISVFAGLLVWTLRRRQQALATN